VFKRFKTLRALLFIGGIEILIVGSLSYFAYKYAKKAFQTYVPEKINAISTTYEEVMGTPVPSEIQESLDKINHLFKEDPRDYEYNGEDYGPISYEKIETLPSSPLNPQNEKHLDQSKNLDPIELWITKTQIESLVISKSSPNRISLMGQVYLQGSIINKQHALQWIGTSENPNGTMQIQLRTPDGKIYIKNF
tara:strand:+ start:154 stop:732 length:579 start_codon:yes stop_codon:yes gene_type:complete